MVLSSSTAHSAPDIVSGWEKWCLEISTKLTMETFEISRNFPIKFGVKVPYKNVFRYRVDAHLLLENHSQFDHGMALTLR